jgi:hypothetical protein
MNAKPYNTTLSKLNSGTSYKRAEKKAYEEAKVPYDYDSHILDHSLYLTCDKAEMKYIFDQLCQCLNTMTKTSAGTFAAIQEWDIEVAIKNFAPPPLSGLLFPTDDQIIGGNLTSTSGLPKQTTTTTNGGTVPVNTSNGATNNSTVPNTNTKPSTASTKAFTAATSTEQNTSAVEITTLPNPSSENPSDYANIQTSSDTSNRLQLMEIPPSFFLLCSQLCQVKEGKSIVFGQGFLRSALDKLVLLYHQLQCTDEYKSQVANRASRKGKRKPQQAGTSSTGLNLQMDDLNLSWNGPSSSTKNPKPAPTVSWEEVKVNINASLKVISVCANYHNRKYGSANDVILHELYATIAVCKDIISLNVPRVDEIIASAYSVFMNLAKDTYRFQSYLTDYALYDVIEKDLFLLDYDFPVDTIVMILQTIICSCQTTTSPYIVSKIAALRGPIVKVARIYPEIADVARQANWMLMKSGMLYRDTIDPTFVVLSEQEENVVGINEYIRTGDWNTLKNSNMFSSQFAALDPPATINTGTDEKGFGFGNPPPIGTTIDAMNSYTTATDDTMKSNELYPSNSNSVPNVYAGQEGNISKNKTQQENVPSKPPTPSLESSSVVTDPDEIAGTYFFCGVGTCGSLRNMDAPCEHGEYCQMIESDRQKKLMKQPIFITSPKKSMEIGGKSAVSELNLSALDISGGKEVVKDDLLLPITKLSARGKLLREVIATRKGKEGFSEIQKMKIYDTPHSAPNTSKPMKTADLVLSKSEKQIDMFTSPTKLSKPVQSSSPSIQSKGSRMISNTLKSGGKSLISQSLSSNSSYASQRTAALTTFTLEDIPELAFTRPPPK